MDLHLSACAAARCSRSRRRSRRLLNLATPFTHLAHKYLMTLIRLHTQQLYMAAGENEGEGSSMGSPLGGSLSLAEPVACAGSSAPLLCSDAIPREGQQSEQLCVVCHYFPLSRALLPCRHTCICAICFCEYDKAASLMRRIDEKRLRRNGETLDKPPPAISDHAFSIPTSVASQKHSFEATSAKEILLRFSPEQCANICFPSWCLCRHLSPREHLRLSQSS